MKSQRKTVDMSGLLEKLKVFCRRRWLWLAAVLTALCLLMEATGLTDRLLVLCGVVELHEQPSGNEIQVHTLDVGNADALLVLCDGQSMLIDAGDQDDSDTITAYLQSYGIEHLNYVVATHADADHIGGMREVLSHFSVGEYWMATMPYGADPTTETYLQLLAYLEEAHVPVTEVEVGMVRELGEADIRVLAPTFASEESNEQSVVCLVTYRNTRFLFMGDAETSVEATLLSKEVDADFLKVGHHGAENTSSAEFLHAVSPSVAVISCGKDNLYGHPAYGVVSRLKEVGAAIYRTDRNGHIVVKSDGDTLRVITEVRDAA